MIYKPTIEQKAYADFCKRFEAGEFGSQRFGQAFYNEFDLHKLADQTQLHNLWAKDGDHAKKSIANIFTFN